MKAAVCVVLMALGFVQACSIVHRTEKPAVVAPERWLAASGSARVEREWWVGFGDPVLTRLIDEALVRNLDVRQSAARVAEARALSDAQRAAALPSLDFAGVAQRSRSVHPVTGRPYLSNVAQPQFVAAYEIDVWGRIDALIVAARTDAESLTAARDAVREAAARRRSSAAARPVPSPRAL